MEDTPVGQEILRIGEQRGELRGEQRGEQRLLLRLITARFGNVPEDIRQKIQTLQDTENIEQLATLLLTIQSVEELKNLVN